MIMSADHTRCVCIQVGAAGYMGYNATAGLSFLMVCVNSFNRNMNFNSVTAHELGTV